MTEQRTSLIEVGDEVDVMGGYRMVVTRVEIGKNGLFWGGFVPELGGTDDGTCHDCGYLPYELPPVTKTQRHFHGWAARGTVTLASGVKVGYVCFTASNPHRNLPAHEAEWERTIEAMRSEEMQHRPTSLRVG